MRAESSLIEWLLEQPITKYHISKATGIHQTTLANIEDGKTSLEKLSFKTAAILTEYAERYMKEENI